MYNIKDKKDFIPNLDEAINASKALIQNQSYIYNVANFDRYAPCYFFTTEVIRAYLEEVTNKDRALSVIGSGDQIFNLLVKDFKAIDSFDINQLTYYNFYLKQAIIMSFTYEEFLKANKCGWFLYRLEDFANLLERIKGNMPSDVYLYYRSLIELVNNVSVLRSFINGNEYTYQESSNIYANSLENYKRLQKAIEKIQVHLYFDDAINIPKKVLGGYDFITLSNIADYLGVGKSFTINEFNQYIASYYALLNKGGVIINYMYVREGCVIENSNITMNELGRSNVYPINGTTESYYLVRKP